MRLIARLRSLRAQRLKNFNLAWNFNSCLEIPISIEIFSLDLPNSPPQNRGLVGGSLEMSEGPKGGRRKGGRGRKLSHFSFCCAFRCCVVYSPCFPVWGEEKVMTIYDAGPLAAGPLCGLLKMFNLAWKFQPRRAILRFFNLLALRDGPNRQSLVFSERGHLSQAILQVHVERILHQWTPITRFESQHNERKVYEDQTLCFQLGIRKGGGKTYRAILGRDNVP